MDSIMDFAKKQMSGGGGGDDDQRRQQYGNQGYDQQDQGGYGQQGGFGGQQGGMMGGGMMGGGQQGGFMGGGQQGDFNGDQQGGFMGGQQGGMMGGGMMGGGQQGSFMGGQGGYGQEQGGFGAGGGQQFNRPHGQGGAGGLGGMFQMDDNLAIEAANEHAGNGNENAGLFANAMSYIGGMSKDDDNDVDDDAVTQEHDRAYGQGQAGNMAAGSMGSAAAMQALKMFTSGQSGVSTGGGGNMQSKMIGMAMSEAAKLFDQSGGAASGTKQDAVSSAGQMVMKLILKQQMQGMMGGGGGGGMGGLMGMASKFMM